MAKHKFEKGNAYGKLGGRPKGSSFVKVCQEIAEATEWDRLQAWASGIENGKRVPWLIRKYANAMLLAYAYGKPSERLDVTSGGLSIRDWILSQLNQANERRGVVPRLPEANAGDTRVVFDEGTRSDTMAETDRDHREREK